MKLPIPAAALEQHLIALGKTGSGKSSKLRVLVEGLLESGDPVCIVDPKGDWWGIKSSADGKSKGYPVVIFGGEHADVPLNARAGAQVAELIASGNRPALIDLSGFTVGERTRLWIDFASSFFKHARGKRHLIIDEVHNFAPQGKVIDVDAGRALYWTNRLASEGRGKGITLFCASQRPAKVHKDLVTGCETLIACRVIHPLDRKAMKEWIDGAGDPAKGTEVLQSLATMKRGEAWSWSPEIDFGPERRLWPMFWTYDSFKPQDVSHAKLKGWAEVDLEDVRGRLAAVVQEAEANDPAKLRARIADLERETVRHDKLPKAASREQLAEADRKGYERGVQDGAEKSERAGRAHLKTLKNSLHQAVEETFRNERDPLAWSAPQNVPAPGRIMSENASRAAREVLRAKPLILKRAPPPKCLNGDSAVTVPQQKILDKLAWLEGHGLYPAPKETLAAVCNVSPTSGGYFNNLGALRSAGLIDYPSPGEVGFTDDGRRAANPTDDPRPVHEHWLEVVTAPQRKILEALIARHPDPIEKDALAGEVNVSPTSGGYFNNLGRLRTLGAIDYPQRGHVALTRHVMP